MNPRYEKVCAELEKNRAKIANLQNRQRELERQKTEMENSDIVAAFRSTNIDPQELARYIQAFQQDGGKGSDAGAAQAGIPAAAPAANLTKQQEESDIESE